MYEHPFIPNEHISEELLCVICNEDKTSHIEIVEIEEIFEDREALMLQRT
jgi:hypothetical protein